MLVKVRNAFFGKAHLYATGVQREFNYFEGELVATPKWVDYPAIALSTGLKKFSFRIIPKADIIEVDGKVTAKPPEVSIAKVRTFEIKGSKGDVYTVNIGEKSSDCTCVAYQFRRSCKHIKEASEKYHGK